jgi:hypothetical protein
MTFFLPRRFEIGSSSVFLPNQIARNGVVCNPRFPAAPEANRDRFATQGQIGFSERSGYTQLGRSATSPQGLCAEAKDEQILVSSRIAEAVEAVAEVEASRKPGPEGSPTTGRGIQCRGAS